MITRWKIRASISTAIIFVGIMLCASVNAQQSRLPSCPENQSAVWHECFGKHTAPNGDFYIGEFKNGKYEGQGKRIRADGRVAVGEFKNDKLNGMAEVKNPDGKVYKGQIKDDVIHGQGKLSWPDGTKYVGEFKDNQSNGQGTYTDPDGTKYSGEYRDGKFHGQGTYTWPDGKKHLGQFRDGKFHGEGIRYRVDGSIVLMGIWANDKFIRQANVNPTPPPISGPKSSSGTAFRISNGQFVTNHHVVDGCNIIKIGGMQGGRILSSDPINDLALIAIPNDSGEIASIRTTRTQLNEAVTAAGFPLQSVFSGIAITNGTVSRLSGLKGDTGQVQISAPVQPGNSGGPLLDSAGNVIGVVSGKLNAMKVAGIIGDVPQNVNFAITGNALRAFLDAKGVNYKETGNERELTGVQIAARASAFTALVECQ